MWLQTNFKNDRHHHVWPSQRPAPRFIHARDKDEFAEPEVAPEFEMVAVMELRLPFLTRMTSALPLHCRRKDWGDEPRPYP